MAKLLPLRFHHEPSWIGRTLEPTCCSHEEPYSWQYNCRIIADDGNCFTVDSLLLDNMRHSILDTVNCLQLSLMTLLEVENKHMNKPMYFSAKIVECHFHLVNTIILQQCLYWTSVIINRFEHNLNHLNRALLISAAAGSPAQLHYGRPDKPSHQKTSARFYFAHTDRVCGLYSISKVFTQQS